MAIAPSRSCAGLGRDNLVALLAKHVPFSHITKNNESDLLSGQPKRLLILTSPK